MNSMSEHPIINAADIGPSMLSFRRSGADTEAALSLCALGRTSTSTGSANTHVHCSKTCYSYSPSIEETSPAINSMVVAVAPTSARRSADWRSIPELTGGSTQLRKKATSIITPQRKHMKPRDPKRDTSISFEEMQRIMNVYGPIKAGRNRRETNRAIGREVQPESIKRKFYRWFPDFNDRFIKTADGTFTPFIGHEQELDYREAMRGWNQELLIKKRLGTRYLPPMYHSKTYFH